MVVVIVVVVIVEVVVEVVVASSEAVGYTFPKPVSQDPRNFRENMFVLYTCILQ